MKGREGRQPEVQKLKAFSFRTRVESSNCRFQGDEELQGSELNLQLNGLETTPYQLLKKHG